MKKKELIYRIKNYVVHFLDMGIHVLINAREKRIRILIILIILLFKMKRII